MNSYLQFVNSIGTNPWIGSIIAVIGVALAIIFYFKGKKVKLPCYGIRSTNMIQDLVSKFESLEMLYGGQPIENLTVTKIAFWNAGSETINSQDIPKAEPLIIKIKEPYKILDAKILYTKNPANQFSISTSVDRSYVNLQFDYVDKEEGIVIQCIHTGISDEDIEIHGVLKGAGKPIKKYRQPLFFPPLIRKTGNKYERLTLAIISFGTPLIVIIFFILNIETFKIKYVSVSGIISISTLGIMTIFYWYIGYYLIKRRIPKGFDIFEEEI